MAVLVGPPGELGQQRGQGRSLRYPMEMACMRQLADDEPR
jgi:hypothetical protein